MASYVGIDLHRRRSVIVALDEAGDQVWSSRIENSRMNLELELRAIIEKVEAPVHVVVEATWGWYWTVEVIATVGAEMHLAHPLAIKGYENRRVKTDWLDAELLADLLRMGRLPEAWIAPGSIRELRELVRYRRKLAQLQTGLKAQVHQTLGKEGAIPETKSIWHSGGQRWLDELQMADAFTNRVESLRDLLEAFHTEIATLDGLIHRTIMTDPDLRDGYEAIQAIGGVGRVLAAVFVAEIGDVHRFPDPRRLGSWAGLTPRHRESDIKIRRGRMTKQGPVLVRWACIEAVTNSHCEPRLRAVKYRVAERRGIKIGKVAAARELLALVFYGLRDGEIRCLQDRHQPTAA
jgi:transposase